MPGDKNELEVCQLCWGIWVTKAGELWDWWKGSLK